MDFAADGIRERRREAREVRLMLALIYPFCLGAAVLARAIGREGAPRRSVFAEAAASASACIPFVFR